MADSNSSDQFFIDRLTKIVIANLSKESFDVGELAREAHMSRSSIHRRLKCLTNQNASQFIREIRLHKALEILQIDLSTVAEVAYKVGFGSPTYFTKCFHEYYGYPPGEARKRMPAVGAVNLNTSAPESSPRNSFAAGMSAGKIIIVAIVLFGLALIVALLLKNGHQQLSQDKSIVILPFKNLTGEPDNQYFADGIMEDILNSLYHVSGLRVISRTTSEHYRDTDMTSREISRQVNARNVLEGSIRRQEDKIRISVQLIDAHRDQHIWSENFDRVLTDVLGVQGEIAVQVADRLKAVISDAEARQIKKIPTRNPEAYDHYLRARFLLHQANDQERFDISKEGLLSSLKYYEMAIAADSSFAEAYAGLANAWYNLSAWGWYKPYQDGITQARRYFTRALELDPDCAEAHAVKGIYLAYPEGRFDEAHRELKTSIRLNPNFSTAHQWYAQLLMITGPIEEARKHIDIALELEPYFWVIHNLSSWIYYFEEKYDKGLESSSAGRDLNPNSLDNSWLFVLHSVRLGEGESAAKELHDIFSTYLPSEPYSDEVMDAFKVSGIEGIFKWLIDLNINRPIPIEGLDGNPFYLSWWFAILSDRERSIYWLEKTAEANWKPRHYFNLIATNPDFDILRNDPRFLAIIEKEGLSPYNTRPAR